MFYRYFPFSLRFSDHFLVIVKVSAANLPDIDQHRDKRTRGTHWYRMITSGLPLVLRYYDLLMPAYVVLAEVVTIWFGLWGLPKF